MHDLAMNRRTLLKVGLLGGAIRAAGGLLGRCAGATAAVPASGFAVLRESDLPMLHRLIPLLLQGSVPPAEMPQAAADTLISLDQGLHHLSPALAAQVRQLFDVLTPLQMQKNRPNQTV